MSSKDNQETPNIDRMAPTHMIQSKPIPYSMNSKIYYDPLQPHEVLELYRDRIEQYAREKWPSLGANFHIELGDTEFYYHDQFGGQYHHTYYLPNDKMIQVKIVEPFEDKDGELANDRQERKRRAQLTFI